MRVMTLLFLALACLCVSEPTFSGETAKPFGYPAKPIEAIVPFAAGGGLDTSIRLLAKYAELELREKIVVLNLTQGGNIQGNLRSINAAPDGYTLGCWGMGLVTDELVVKNVPYTHKDVLPLCMYARDPHIIAVGAQFATQRGIRTLDDLIDYVRKNPGQVTFGSGGNWTSHDFIRLKLEEQAGIKFARMPFLGGAPALQAAASGNCDVVTPFPSEFIPYAESGKIVPLAVSYPQRLRRFPNIPTTVEVGFPDMLQSMWRVLALPKGTPRSTAEYLESVFAKAAVNEDYVREADEMGINTEFLGSKELEEFLDQEYHFFAEATERLGVRVDRDAADSGGTP